MVSCTYCSTELPDGAMFCGECGRALPLVVAPSGARTMVPRPLTRPVPEPQPADAAGAADVCAQCGALLAPDDIFCGECGFLAHAAGAASARPRDTNAVERLEPVAEDPATDEPVLEDLVPEEPVADEPAVDEAVERAAPDSTAPDAAEPDDVGPDDAEPDDIQPDDLEATRIVTRRLDGARFVLQFSTGESFTVFGTGLIGRNPRPEPGEYFDELVRVLDPSRSVSKTHLEFGQESGGFWVKDRFSGNGTIVREPESAPLRCRPDRRYRLARGSRVDMGEQFFIVS